MVASQVSWRQSSRSTKGFAGVTAYGTTDCGRVRKHNEDVVGVYNDAGLYVVCDGMGGHAGGEVASSLALSAIHTNMAQSYHSPSSGIQDPARYSRQSLDSAILRANRVVKDRAAKDTALKGMGTTLAAMHVTDAHVAIGHVGDSRVYRWRKHTGLDQLTRDHSLMNQLIDQGELPAQTTDFPWSNVIVKAIGMRGCQADTALLPRREGDLYLLCSDGLTDLVNARRIEAILSTHRHDLERTAKELIDAANEAGGFDNISVVLVRFDENTTVFAPSCDRSEDEQHKNREDGFAFKAPVPPNRRWALRPPTRITRVL